MIIAYGLISRELYRGIQFELGQNTETTGEIHHKFYPNCKRLFVHTDLTHTADENIYFTFIDLYEAAGNYIRKTGNSRLYLCLGKYDNHQRFNSCLNLYFNVNVVQFLIDANHHK